MNIEPKKLKFFIAFGALCLILIAGFLIFLYEDEGGNNVFEHTPPQVVTDKAITFPEGVEQAFWRSHGVELPSDDEGEHHVLFEIYELYTADGVNIPITSEDAKLSEQNPQGKTFSIVSDRDHYLVNVFPPMKEGLYVFRVDTADGKTYRADINWRAPLPVEVDNVGSPEEGYAYFEARDLDISELEIGIFYRDPDWQISEFLPSEIIENGLLKLRLEDIGGGEHLYLFKKDGVWYQIELNYPEDF